MMSVIVVVFLMTLVALGITTYSHWFSTFMYEEEAYAEENSNSQIRVENLIGTTLYLVNMRNVPAEITNVEIEGNDCNVILDILPGLNEINVGNCVDGMNNKVGEIVVFTPEYIYTGYENIRNVPYFPQGAIGNCGQLMQVYDDLNGDYYLTKDIYCYDSKNWNGGKGFDPIGAKENGFTGTFDGNDFAIRGLYVNDLGTGYHGMFAWLEGASITDLVLPDVQINGKDYVGGLAGYAENSIISGVQVGGNISGNKEYTAGIVSFAMNSIIIDSSFNKGSIYGTQEYTGGLVSFLEGSTLTNSYAIGKVEGIEEYVGGLVGEARSSVIMNSYSIGEVVSRTNEEFGGGLIGGMSSTVVTNSYWNTQTSGKDVSAGGTPKNTTQMMQQATYTGWDFNNTWAIIENNSYPTLR